MDLDALSEYLVESLLRPALLSSSSASSLSDTDPEDHKPSELDQLIDGESSGTTRGFSSFLTVTILVRVGWQVSASF